MSKLRFGSDYIPLVDEEFSRYRIVLTFPKIVWTTVALTFLAFTFCILWSIVYNFEKATETHCKVYNVLPSVSAVIGHYKPQKNVWEIAISFQAAVRLVVLFMYYKYYKETTYKWASGICNFALLSYFLENISLVNLSFWSSNENYVIHKISFIAFLAMSIMHMILLYTIASNCRKVLADHYDSVSLKWKFRALIINISSIVMACYFFYRHNKYCEPLVYSMFSLSEYTVVVTNMLFHVTGAFDFSGRGVLISVNGIRII